jgi:hypothetical protein
VWALAELKGKPPEHTSFPICDRPEKFFEFTVSSGNSRGRRRPKRKKRTRVLTDTCGAYKITGRRPDAKALIKGVQPYHGGEVG